MNAEYKYLGHRLVPLNGVGKNYCFVCGLVAINNDVTRWCIEKGCYHEDHPQYKSKLKQFTKRDYKI